jgi:hypothetical protein
MQQQTVRLHLHAPWVSVSGGMLLHLRQHMHFGRVMAKRAPPRTKLQTKLQQLKLMLPL